ncbi:MAG TPA: periplasmic heavy metal sensor [Methylomirabilota bacterium]|nr:periplasmic heavy metal sensor [Methylomirabilota bacterium]
MKVMTFGLLAAAILAGSNLSAQQDAGNQPPAGGNRPERGQRGPSGGPGMEGLTEEQRNAVRTELQAMNTATTEQRAKLRDAQTALRDAMFAEKLDEAAIRAKAADIGKIEGEIAVIRAKHYATLKGKLPAEAFARLKNSSMGMGPMMGGGFGGGEGGMRRREGGDAGGAPGGGERPRRNRPEGQ